MTHTHSLFARLCLATLALLILSAADSSGYPVDGYEYSGIRRLERPRQIVAGTLSGRLIAPGARLSMSHVALRLKHLPASSQPMAQPDSGLQQSLKALFKDKDPSYACVVIDMTPGRSVRYASWKGERLSNPGSVGKLAIAAGLFAELQRIYPTGIDKRMEMLKTRVIAADDWVISNHHEVPFFDLKTKSYVARKVKPGDTFSLWEWLDHMLSASSNAAASIVWKEVMLMRAFGSSYPPPRDKETAWFAQTPRDSLKAVALSVVNDPLRALAIPREDWQLGSFFTSTGKKRVPGTNSYANPRALMQLIVAMERGVFVDEWSSSELKRLLYLTIRRVRYAQSSRLDSAAVYFKSGSQYKCKDEEGFTCGQYMGNVDNFLNAVAIVEQPDSTTYAVVLMSNVLRKNSADDHRDIATAIDRLLRPPPAKPAAVPSPKLSLPPAVNP